MLRLLQVTCHDYNVIKPSFAIAPRVSSLKATYECGSSFITFPTERLAVGRHRINILAIRSIQRNGPNDLSRLEPDPCLELAQGQLVLPQQHLPRPALPVSVAAVARPLAEADVKPATLGLHGVVRKRVRRPLVTPRVTVLVRSEEAQHARRRRDGLHEGYVLSAVRAGAVVDAVGTVPDRLACDDHVVDPRLSLRIDPGTGLHGRKGVEGNVDETQGRDGLVEFRDDALVLGEEPVNNIGINPIGARDPLPVRPELLVLKATS